MYKGKGCAVVHRFVVVWNIECDGKLMMLDGGLNDGRSRCAPIRVLINDAANPGMRREAGCWKCDPLNEP